MPKAKKLKQLSTLPGACENCGNLEAPYIASRPGDPLVVLCVVCYDEMIEEMTQSVRSDNEQL